MRHIALALILAPSLALAGPFSDRSRSGGGFSGGTLTLDTALVSGVHLLLSQDNDAVTPSLGFGDGDTGWYESVDDNLVLSMAGVARFKATGNSWQGVVTGSPIMLNEVASSINPTFAPDATDVDTGLGADGADTAYIIAGGVGTLAVTATTTKANGMFYTDELGAYGSVSMYDVSDPYGEGAGGSVNIDASGASGNCSSASAWVLISDATDCVAGDLTNFTASNCVLTAGRTHHVRATFHASFSGSAGDDIFVGIADNASLPPDPTCQTRRDASSAGAAGASSGGCEFIVTSGHTISVYFCNQSTVTNDIDIERFTLNTSYLGDD